MVASSFKRDATVRSASVAFVRENLCQIAIKTQSEAAGILKPGKILKTFLKRILSGRGSVFFVITLREVSFPEFRILCHQMRTPISIFSRNILQGVVIVFNLNIRMPAITVCSGRSRRSAKLYYRS